MAASARTPGEAAWPEQMITQAEAFTLAADWPVYAHWPMAIDGALDHQTILLRCGRCNGSTGQLRHGGTPYNASLDEMLSMVLRHMVMAHDVPLAGLRKEATDGT